MQTSPLKKMELYLQIRLHGVDMGCDNFADDDNEVHEPQ